MKIFVTAVFAMFSTVATYGQLSLGVQGFGNLSDAQIEASDLLSPKKTSRMLPGAGIVADLTINPGLFVRTGINYQQNGIVLKSSFAGIPGEINEISVKGKLKLHYVQVPLQVLFSTKGNIRFYAGGGPFASFAVKGKGTQETTYKFADGTTATEYEESDVFEKDDNGKTTFKRMDFGVGAIAGVKLPGGLFANLGYQYSFSNLSRQQGEEYRNRGLQLTIGYYLWSR